MKRRFRASYQIAIGFAAFALLGVYGYRFANDYLLGRDKFPPLIPGAVNLVGVDTSAGYAILVENRTAKLVIGSSDEFKAGSMDEKSLEDSGGEKKFIPIKDMLKGLQGDVAGLSYFVERLNDINNNEAPDVPSWKVEDIQKAMGGDQALKTKLVHDLNMTLDGTPLDHFPTSGLPNGIFVDAPVPLQIQMGTTRKTVVARVRRIYRPSFLTRIENRLSNRNFDLHTIASEYAAEARDIASGAQPRERFSISIKRFSQDAATLAERPQQILDSIFPVINEDQITGASYTSQDVPKGKQFTLVINLTEEGRKRLYQYSRDRVGSQLLLTVNGVAISAPFIPHALSDGEAQIGPLEDQSLVQDAVDTINSTRKKTTK